nr:uncharacterized protein LOC112775928 [Arachis hypogaea]
MEVCKQREDAPFYPEPPREGSLPSSPATIAAVRASVSRRQICRRERNRTRVEREVVAGTFCRRWNSAAAAAMAAAPLPPRNAMEGRLLLRCSCRRLDPPLPLPTAEQKNRKGKEKRGRTGEGREEEGREVAPVGVTATVAAVVSSRGRPEPREREPRKEKEASPSRVAVVTVEVFIVAVHGGLQTEGRRAVLPRAATGRVVAVKPSHHCGRSCLRFAPPNLSPGEKQNACEERSGRREVLPPLELRCCCCYGRRQETPRRDVCCCVVHVAVWMYLDQVVVAAGAELFLSLSRFPGLSLAPFCRYSSPYSALIHFILLQSSLS